MTPVLGPESERAISLAVHGASYDEPQTVCTALCASERKGVRFQDPP